MVESIFPRVGITPDNAKQRVIAHRQEKAPCEALPGPAAQREAEMMNQPLQPRCPAGKRMGYRRFKPLNKDPLAAVGQEAAEPAGQDLDPNQFRLGRKVRQDTLISAVNPGR